MATPIETVKAAAGYETPSLVVLGTLHELTLSHTCSDKSFGGADGHTLLGIPITCTSG